MSMLIEKSRSMKKTPYLINRFEEQEKTTLTSCQKDNLPALTPLIRAEDSARFTPVSSGQNVIWGSLIADGYSNPRGCVTLDHSVPSAPYVYWKWQCLAVDEMITLKSTPRLCTRLDRRSGTWTYSLRFNSRTLFYSERQLLYVCRGGEKGKNVKSFPTLKESASRWTPAALAVWYMDDGGRGGNSKRGCVIDVSCYAPHGLKRIKPTLRKIYQIETSFQRGSGKTVKLFILEKSADQFRDLVAPYIIPSMWYKVSHLYS